MRVISFIGDLLLRLKGSRHPVRFIKDKKYITTEAFIDETRAVHGNIISFNSDLNLYIPPEKKYNGQPLDGKRLFIIRSGGIGDLMAVMVGVHILKEKYPDLKVVIGSAEMYRDMFEGDPSIYKFFPKPYPFEELEKADYFLEFQGLVESGELSRKHNLYDLFLIRFKLEGVPDKEKTPKLFLNDKVDSEIEELFRRFKIKNDSPIAGIQIKTSTIVRDYPLMYFRDMIQLLNSEGINTVVIGEPENKDDVINHLLCDNEKSFDFTDYGISLNHLFSIINHCDFIIGPDTSGLHIAGALEKPMVGLFGPIPSVLRLGYFKNAIGFDCKTKCAPCFRHGSNRCRFADQFGGYSPCMYLARPETVVDVVNNEILPLFGINKYVTAKQIPEANETTEINDNLKKALITLAIGDEANEMLKIAMPSFEAYAEKIGADLIIINENKLNITHPQLGIPLPNIEKFQIKEIMDRYDRAIYLDIDIIIHPECPDLFNIVPIDMVGAVPDNFNGTWDNINRYNDIASAQDSLGDIGWKSGYFNSGVMVFSKEHIGIFDNPKDREKMNCQFRDQTLINYNFQKHEYKFFVLNKIFNGMEITGFSSRRNPQNKTDAYIMHFAFEGEKLEQMHKIASLFNKFGIAEYPTDKPLLFYDVGEIGWSMYLSAHINHLRLNSQENMIVCADKAKRVLYPEDVQFIDIPPEVKEKLGEFDLDGSCLFDKETKKTVPHTFIDKVFEEHFPDYHVVREHGSFLERRKFFNYKASAKMDVNAKTLIGDTRVILVFPRKREEKFSKRNLSEEFYTSLCKELCDKYSGHTIMAVGATGSSYDLSDFLDDYDNFLDLVSWKDEESLDLFIAICNSGKVDLAIGSQSALPKISLLLNVPTFMLGHERERHIKIENWNNTRAGFYDVNIESKDFSYHMTEDDMKDAINQIIEFGQIPLPLDKGRDDLPLDEVENIKIKNFYDEAPMLYYDVGELGWTQYLVAYLKHKRGLEPWGRRMIVTTTKDKFVFYRDCCDELVEIPDGVKRILSHYEPDMYFLRNPIDRNDRLAGKSLSSLFVPTFPHCSIFDGYSLIRNTPKKHYRPYISTDEARDIVKEICPDDTKSIIIFPRNRVGAYGMRNLSEDFYIRLCNELSSMYENHLIITHGAVNSSYNLKGKVFTNKYYDLVEYDNDKTLDILVAFGNLKKCSLTIGAQSGPPKIALLCGIPSFMIGHEMDRHKFKENWAKTYCEFFEAEKTSEGYEFGENKCVDEIIKFTHNVIRKGKKWM